MSQKDKHVRYSPGKLYEFKPGESITPELVIELTRVIRVGVGGHVLKEMSKELQEHFVEVK
jgi:hypothetical protein